MPKLWNYNKGDFEFVDDAEVQDKILSRQYTFTTDSMVAIRDPRDPTANHFVPGSEAYRFFKNGYMYEPAGIRDQQMLKEQYGKDWGAGLGFGALKSLPFVGEFALRNMLSDREYEGIKEYAPGTTIGEIGGIDAQLFGPQAILKAPSLLGKGGQSLDAAKALAARVLERGTASQAAKMGARAAGHATKGLDRLGSRAATWGGARFIEGAVDAGIYEGAHTLSEEMLGDPEEVGQNLVGRVGVPALLGGSLNVLLPGVGKMLMPLGQQALGSIVEKATGAALNTKTLKRGREMLEKELELRNSQEFAEARRLLDATPDGVEARIENTWNNYDYDGMVRELELEHKKLELEIDAIREEASIDFETRQVTIAKIEAEVQAIEAAQVNLVAQRDALKPKFDEVKATVQKQYSDVIEQEQNGLFRSLESLNTKMLETQRSIASGKTEAIADRIDGDNFDDFFNGANPLIYERSTNSLKTAYDQSNLVAENTPLRMNLDEVIDKNTTRARIELIEQLQVVKDQVALVNPRLAGRLNNLRALGLKAVDGRRETIQAMDNVFEELIIDEGQRRIIFHALSRDAKQQIKRSAFMRADDLKKGIADVLFNMGEGQIGRNGARILQSLSWGPLRRLLEDERVFGEAAKFQNNLNNPLSTLIDAQSDFLDTFGVALDLERGAIVDAGKVARFGKDVGSIGSDTHSRILSGYLDSVEQLARVVRDENLPGVNKQVVANVNELLANARASLKALTETGQMQRTLNQMTGKAKLTDEARESMGDPGDDVYQVYDEIAKFEERIAAQATGFSPNSATPIGSLPRSVLNKIKGDLEGDKKQVESAIKTWKAHMAVQKRSLEDSAPISMKWRPQSDAADRASFSDIVPSEAAGGAGYLLGGYSGALVARLGVKSLAGLLRGGRPESYRKLLAIYDQGYNLKNEARNTVEVIMFEGIQQAEKGLPQPMQSLRILLTGMLGREWGKSTEGQDDFTAISNGLDEMYYNGQLQADIINKATLPIANEMPRTAQAVQNQLARSVGYLHAQMPKQPARDYGSFKRYTYQPAEGPRRKFERAIEVVLEPHKTTMASLKSGVWTGDMTAGLRSVAPMVYSQWAEAIQELTWDEMLSYQERLLFETFLQSGQEPTRRAQFVDTMNAVHGARQQADTEQDPSAAALKPLARDTQTFAMRRSGGGLP